MALYLSTNKLNNSINIDLLIAPMDRAMKVLSNETALNQRNILTIPGHQAKTTRIVVQALG